MIGYLQATATHAGQVREINQDRALVADNLAAVADGMGGHVGGEVAAALAIAELGANRGRMTPDRLIRAAKAANAKVFAEAADPSLRGMGTTLVIASVDHKADIVHLVNIGDSRAYRLRQGQLDQVTVDHSLVEGLVREGRLTPTEALTHPQRNIVTRALGIGEAVDVDHFEVDAQIGDRFVLCSDGLSNEVDDPGIATILAQAASVEEAAEVLVSTAVANGGRDNVTVAVIEIVDPDDPRLPPLSPPTMEVDAVVLDASDPHNPDRFDPSAFDADDFNEGPYGAPDDPNEFGPTDDAPTQDVPVVGGPVDAEPIDAEPINAEPIDTDEVAADLGATPLGLDLEQTAPEASTPASGEVDQLAGESKGQKTAKGGRARWILLALLAAAVAAAAAYALTSSLGDDPAPTTTTQLITTTSRASTTSTSNGPTTTRPASSGRPTATTNAPLSSESTSAGG